MADLDLRMVIQTLFPNKGQLDQAMAAIKTFQDGQRQRNEMLIAQGRQMMAQMAQHGQLSKAQLQGMNQVLTTQAAAWQNVGKGAQGAADAMERFGTQGKFAVRVLEAFVLYRGFVFLQQGAVNVVNTLVDLQHQVNLILTQLPNFGEGMRSVVTRGIIDVAKETGQTFQQVGDALYQITSAGYDADDALKALTLTAKAAVAGGTDSATAFNAALSQMNAFGIEANRLEEVYDKQFALVRRGIFSYQQLATIVGITADSFAQAGQSLETSNAALATISEVFTGPQLARGATALRNLIQAVSDKPEAFQTLGVYTRDAKGDVRNFIAVMEELKVSLDGLSTGERNDALRDILPDDRERAGALAILENLDSLKRNYIEQKLALGDLNNAYEVFNNDVKKQTGILKNSIESGFKPLANAVGTVVYGFNLVEKTLPGFTSATIAATGAVTTLAIAQAFLASRTQIAVQSSVLATRAIETEMVATTRLIALKTVLASRSFRFGAAGIAGVGLGAGIEGATGGSALGFVGSVAAGAGSGALLGMGLGPQGAAIAAAVGGITSALSFGIRAWSDNMKDASKEGGIAFADAFAEALKANQGDIASSLAEALDRSASEDRDSDIDRFLARAARGNLTNWEFVNPANVPDVPGGTSSTRIKPVSRNEELLPKVDPGEFFTRAWNAGNRASMDFNNPQNLALIENFVREENRRGNAVDLDDFTEAARQQAITDAVERVFPDDAIAQGFAMEMVNGADTLEEFNILLGDLINQDLVSFYDHLNSFEAGVQQIEEVWDLSSNSFADALFSAADMVRFGFAPSAEYTADELELLGEEFAALNKAVKKVSLLKELQGIGEFLGMDRGFLDDAVKEVLEQAKLGGQDLRQLLGDPTKLMEFLDSLIEFGEIKVDQSTHQTAIIRISGDTDLSTFDAAEAADAFLRELNNKNRQSVGR